MSQVKYKSGVSDGATAIGHELDTVNSLTTTGAKLLSIKNAGTEKFFVDKDGNTGTPVVKVVKPLEGSAGINAAISAIATAGGGVIQLLAGTYTIDAALSMPGYYINNLTIQGMGDSTILDVQSGAGFPGGQAVFNIGGQTELLSANLNTATAGDTSIYTTNPASAGYVTAGSYVWVYGYTEGLVDIPHLDAELHRAATNGNGLTGEIPLTEPVLKTMTSGRCNAYKGGVNNTFKNFKVRYSSGTYVAGILKMDGSSKNLIENITVEGFAASSFPSAAISLRGFHNTIRNCVVSNHYAQAIDILGQYNLVENNYCDRADQRDSQYGGTIQLQASYDSIFRKNTILRSLGCGFTTAYGSGSVGLRITFDNNVLRDVKYYQLVLYNSRGLQIINNWFEQGASNACEISGGLDIFVHKNHFRNLIQGVRIQNVASKHYIITQNYFDAVGDPISFQNDNSHHIVANNTFVNSGFYSATNDSVFANNTVVGGSTGMNVYGDTNVIINNVIRSTSGDAINLNSTTNDNLVVGNNYRSDGVTDSGTNNDFIANKS